VLRTFRPFKLLFGFLQYEARHASYEQARTALHERLGDDPRISDAELVTEHHRLEAAIHRVEEDLLLSAMRRFVKDRDGFPFELKLCLKGKGVRTLSGRQVCPAERVLTWINAPICKMLFGQVGEA
jgi:hypothetical protein